MPVKKYRRIEDMPGDRWRTPGDPAIVRTVRHVWSLAALVGPTGIPGGVHKYRSVEEMNADREAWEDKRIQRIRDMRRTK